MNPKRIAIIAVLAAVLMLGFCSRCVSHESGSKSGKRMREGEPSAYLMMHNVTKKNNCFGVESYERHGIADIDYYPARMLRFDPGYYEGATYAEFELQDDYERLLFAAGTDRAGNDERSVLAVFGDGKKLMEHLFVEYSVPEQFELDIKGVKTIRFEIMTGKGGTIVADATLWKSARKAHPLKPLTKAESKPTELVNELPPYHAGGSHTLVGPTRLTDDEWRPKMNINGIQYESGIVMGALMQLIGTGRSCSHFNLGGQYTQLQFIVGPNIADGGTVGRGWMTVRADDKIIYEYECLENDIARVVTLPIEGCRRLSIESENADENLWIAVADIMVYPKGKEPIARLKEVKEEPLKTDRYRDLPDVCPLVRNIPPFLLTGNVSFEGNIFDGRSDYRTFSMGGVKFNEGIILSSKTHWMDDNTRSSAVFYTAGEFDNISFMLGWVSKCGVLKNDTLRIYADDEIVFNMPIIATRPNQYYEVPIHKCQRLIFEKRGIISMTHPVFGVADIVAYRGKVKKNDLFTHPQPELPKEVDLIDLGAPYIHYVPGYHDFMEETYHDGSTKKEYFELANGDRIHKGFLLKTSVHFSLEAGPLGGEGSGTAFAAAGMGASLMVGTVGSSYISAVCPFGALLMLAAGGTMHESSCAAFNAYEAYDEMTFKVTTLQKGFYDRIDTLFIGGSGEVIETIELKQEMPPTEYKVKLNRCGQLMFWLQCGHDNSAPYIIYDIVLRRKR